MKMRVLVSLLRSLPKPDEEYLAVVEDLITKQSQVATWDQRCYCRVSQIR